MRSSLILWIVAVFLTVCLAVFQRVTGPTYPVSGHAFFGGKEIPFRLERTHAGSSDAPVVLLVSDTTIRGTVEWRRNDTGDPWAQITMTRSGDSLIAALPRQPLAGKLQYRVVLSTGSVDGYVPSTEGVVIRFRGDVPPAILYLHILLMFGGMLLSARAGLEFFAPKPSYRLLTWGAVLFLAVGGIVLGPAVQKFAFDAYWTGWPFGTDLTDNKTALALAAWVLAALMLNRSRKPQRWVLGASIVTFLVFVIPHSLLGSSHDYREQDRQTTTSGRQP